MPLFKDTDKAMEKLRAGFTPHLPGGSLLLQDELNVKQ